MNRVLDSSLPPPVPGRPADDPVTKIDIDNLVKNALPPLRGSSLRLLELLRDVNVSARKLAETVSYDPLLTTRILRLANSPIYPLQNDVTSLYQAIDVIGTKSLYDIVVVGLTADAFAREIRSSVLGRSVWEHSLVVALLTRELSQILGLRGVEEAFICGLLHDIGKIMLLRTNAEIYADILEKKEEREMLAWESDLFGYNHAQIGALVAKRWRLPDAVSNTILNHHAAEQATDMQYIVNLVGLADLIANYNGYGLRLEDEAAVFNSGSAVILRLNEEHMFAAWENIQKNLHQVLETFI